MRLISNGHNTQPAGNGARSVRYLASYVFRTAISDHRIIAVRNDQVLFRYSDTKTGRTTTMSLSAFEFIRRFLQHVLPTGFMKIRYYGFMHPSTTMPVKQAVALLEALFTVAPKKPAPTTISGIPPCQHCNGIVRFVQFIGPKKTRPTAGFT